MDMSQFTFENCASQLYTIGNTNDTVVPNREVEVFTHDELGMHIINLTYPNPTKPNPISSHVKPACTHLITRE
jgi:hypothetical protein